MTIHYLFIFFFNQIIMFPTLMKYNRSSNFGLPPAVSLKLMNRMFGNGYAISNNGKPIKSAFSPPEVLTAVACFLISRMIIAVVLSFMFSIWCTGESCKKEIWSLSGWAWMWFCPLQKNVVHLGCFTLSDAVRVSTHDSFAFSNLVSCSQADLNCNALILEKIFSNKNHCWKGWSLLRENLFRL